MQEQAMEWSEEAMKVKDADIGYLWEPDYSSRLRKCVTLKDLLELTADYELLAGDALDIVRKMKPKDFNEWLAGDLKERKGRFAGEAYSKKYGAIALPAEMLNVSMVSMAYKAPFGTCYIRLKEMGKLVIKEGRIVVTLKDAKKPLHIRLPAKLHKKLQKMAVKNRVSMNHIIVNTLEITL